MKRTDHCDNTLVDVTKLPWIINATRYKAKCLWNLLRWLIGM